MFLLVSGNITLETLGCGIQHYIGKNIIYNQLVLFLQIYFMIDISSTQPISPENNLKYSCIIYLFFIIVNRQPLYFSLLSILILGTVYVIIKFIEYYKNDVSRKKTIQTLGYVKDKLIVVLITCNTIGFIFYFFKQINDYSVTGLRISLF